jgi:hypothetical protein
MVVAWSSIKYFKSLSNFKMEERSRDQYEVNGNIRYSISRKEHILRRTIHLTSGLVIIYYLFPRTFLFLPMKLWLIILLGLVPLLIEIIRLRGGLLLFGQRGFERTNIGSFAWALWASGALMIVFPQEIAVPVILVYTVMDPLIGEIRLWKKWLVLPLGGLITILLFLLFDYNILLAIFASVFLVAGEALEIIGRIRIRPELFNIYRISGFKENLEVQFKTDDNATIQILPAMALGLVYIFYPQWFPDPWFYPLF